MSYSYTDTYTNIRNYNKFDEILSEIVQKIEGSPDLFSKKEIKGLKRNIKKLKDWIVENNVMGVEDLSVSSTCINFHSVGLLDGQIQMGNEFKNKIGIKTPFISSAEFYVAFDYFGVRVSGIIYSISSMDNSCDYGMDDV